jgi:hypothetical protein
MTAHNRPRITVCNPTGEPDAPPKQLAPRLQSLRGARIALLDNGKEFSDDVINAIGTVLKHELGVKEIRVWDKEFPAKGAPFIAELARSCDAVITGVGH